MDREEAKFRVAESFVEDAGRGLVRLDAEDLKRLQAVPGDVLLITGRRATVARAAQAPESHCGQLLALIDGTTRGNAQAGVDEWVTMRKVPYHPAKSLLLSTVQAGQRAPTEEELPHLLTLLAGIAVIPGDNLQVSFLGARPRAFTIEAAAPRGALLIAPHTTISFKVPEVSAERRYRRSRARSGAGARNGGAAA